MKCTSKNWGCISQSQFGRATFLGNASETPNVLLVENIPVSKQAIVGHLLDRFDHVRNVQQKACMESGNRKQLTGTQKQQESSMTTSKCQGSAQGAADSKPRKL